MRKTTLNLDALLEKVIAKHRLRRNRTKVDGDDDMDLVDNLLSLGGEDASSANFSLSMDNIKGIVMVTSLPAHPAPVVVTVANDQSIFLPCRI